MNVRTSSDFWQWFKLKTVQETQKAVCWMYITSLKTLNFAKAFGLRC